MAAMSLQDQSVNSLLKYLSSELSHIKFKAGRRFLWSPENGVVSYIAPELRTEQGIWTLLHETGHAQLAHKTYKTDFELLSLEVAAWQQAKLLGKELKITINEDHVQDCLDTYRDWLHKRSTCPTCGTVGLQHTPSEYRCHNCLTNWQVTASRFCRAYRRKSVPSDDKAGIDTMPELVFH